MSQTKSSPFLVASGQDVWLPHPPELRISSHCWVRFCPQSTPLECEEGRTVEMPQALLQAKPKRVAEYVAGRLCARAALQQLGWQHTPGFGHQRQPLWPQGVWGSITHSNGMAVAVVSEKVSIGLDLESILADNIAQEVGDTLMTRTEQQRFSSQLSPRLITLIFSAKESFYKAAFPYVGRLFEFSAMDVLEIDWLEGRLIYRINEPLADNLQVGQTGVAYFCLLPTDRLFSQIWLP